MSARDPIANLISQLARLPGIGEKTAGRLAFHVIRAPESYAHDLAQALIEVKERIDLCSICCNLTSTDPCSICADPSRDRGIILVVEDPREVGAFLTAEYRGLFHVLQGNQQLHLGVHALGLLHGGAEGLVVFGGHQFISEIGVLDTVDEGGQ